MVCAFSGHRQLNKDFSSEELKENIISLIEEGYNTFLCGMAVGFDLIAAETVLELKSDYEIKLKAYVPCLDQSRGFTNEQKEQYNSILKRCDEVKIISEKYSAYCMHKRNRKLVDDCDVLLCHLRKINGGTRYTFNYARECGKRVINV